MTAALKHEVSYKALRNRTSSWAPWHLTCSHTEKAWCSPDERRAPRDWESPWGQNFSFTITSVNPSEAGSVAEGILMLTSRWKNWSTEKLANLPNTMMEWSDWRAKVQGHKRAGSLSVPTSTSCAGHSSVFSCLWAQWELPGSLKPHSHPPLQQTTGPALSLVYKGIQDPTR